MNLSDLWVVEWSRLQGRVHVCSLSRAVTINRRVSRRKVKPGETCDYIPVGVFGSLAEADAFAIKMESELTATEERVADAKGGVS